MSVKSGRERWAAAHPAPKPDEPAESKSTARPMSLVEQVEADVDGGVARGRAMYGRRGLRLEAADPIDAA